jgi:hypothetical protein
MVKKLSFLFLFILGVNLLIAQTFTVNGIKYNVIPFTSNVQVAGFNCYPGILTIPASVLNGGINYTVTSIGNNAFRNCNSLTKISIPNSVTSIKDDAFNSTGLTTITIPNSVTSIGNNAFSYCSNLKYVTIADSVASIGKGAFKNCSRIINFTIPNSVTSIEEETFYGCLDLASIRIPNSVVSIGKNAFSFCSSLFIFIIPNSVVSIGNSTFYYCTELDSVTIPESVTFIGDYAFEYCIRLTSITCNITTPLSINANVFQNMDQEDCSLKVPSGSVSAYQAADVWKNFNPITGSGTLTATNFKNEKNLIVYPNPVHNEAVLELKNAESNQLQVYDMNGKLVMSKSLNNNSKNNINTSKLSFGTYLFNVGNATTKVIKN